MKYVVEKVEGNIVVLESIIDSSKKYITLEELKFSVKENDVLLFDNEEYILDENEKNDRIKRIKDKMDRLKFDN